MNVAVFYAWQSDRPQQLNHYLIRDAATQACARITADLSNDWQVTLDSDTRGAPGMCDIPNTILEKIRKCDIFLVDLTLVGKTEGDPPKLLPNANVVFELGYAARQLGFKALVGIVNEAFGKVESQVFDIKRRACLKYTTEGAETKPQLRQVTEKLSKALEKITRGTIETVVLKKRNIAAVGDALSAETRHNDFAKRVMERRFHELDEKPAVLTTVFFAPQDIDYEKLGGPVREMFRANPIVDSDCYDWRQL